MQIKIPYVNMSHILAQTLCTFYRGLERIDFFTDEAKSWHPFWKHNKTLEDVTFDAAKKETHLLFDTWKPHIEYLDTILQPKENKVILAKGTILYHTSERINPIQNTAKDKSDFLFFGLDSYISTWYVAETINRNASNRGKQYYLNKYILTNDLTVTFQPWKASHYSINDSHAYSEGREECKTTPCLHPQFAHHILEETVGELSLELTLPLKFTTILKFDSVFSVDTIMLIQNMTNPVFSVLETLNQLDSDTEDTSTIIQRIQLQHNTSNWTKIFTANRLL